MSDICVLLSMNRIGILLLVPLGFLLVGLLVARKMSEKIADRSAIYRKAVELETEKDFRYGMETEVGNAFVYGVLAAENPITVKWAPGKYMMVRALTERYQEHQRTVTETETDANGNTYTHYRTETYYSWDVVGRNEEHVRKICFCGVVFPYSSIKMPEPVFYKTEYAGPSLRHQYYVLNQIMRGSIFTELSKDGISKDSPFYLSLHAKEAKEMQVMKEKDRLWRFWLIWFVCGAFVFVMAMMAVAGST